MNVSPPQEQGASMLAFADCIFKADAAAKSNLWGSAGNKRMEVEFNIWLHPTRSQELKGDLAV